MRNFTLKDLSEISLSELQRAPATPTTIGIDRNRAPSEVISLAANQGFHHIVQSDNVAFESEVQTSQQMIQKPQSFLNDPLSVIFDKQTTSPLLRVSSQARSTKHESLAALENYMAALKGVRTIKEQALIAADEIFTNAAKGSGKAKKAEGSDHGLDKIEFLAQADKDRLVLGCIDTFGTLEIEYLTQKIFSCFQNGVADSINQGAGGAGIGSFMVYNSATSLYVAVLKNGKTIVLCSFPLGVKGKELTELPKNIHLLSVAS